jgi:hypothetical protein
MMQKDLKYNQRLLLGKPLRFCVLGIGMLTRTSINGAVLQMVLARVNDSAFLRRYRDDL